MNKTNKVSQILFFSPKIVSIFLSIIPSYGLLVSLIMFKKKKKKKKGFVSELKKSFSTF